ncbi:hypothetical protein D3C72_2236220 [compost metagenome]
MGLGFRPVSSVMRAPNPHAKIIAFTCAPLKSNPILIEASHSIHRTLLVLADQATLARANATKTEKILGRKKYLTSNCTKTNITKKQA